MLVAAAHEWGVGLPSGRPPVIGSRVTSLPSHCYTALGVSNPAQRISDIFVNDNNNEYDKERIALGPSSRHDNENDYYLSNEN